MFVSNNTITAVQQYFKEKLKDSFSDSEIRFLSGLCLQSRLGINSSEIILKKEETVSESDLLFFRACIKELLSGKPIQYVLGETEFYGLNFKVNADVLIPRPETEELVSIILKEQNSAKSILDIGTGSGCIPIALKSELKNAEISGLDVSEKALEVARENSKLNNLEVDFIQADILDANFNLEEPVELIVSNPPYVLESDKADMESNVLDHEPHLALFVEDSDPLLFYRRILEFSQKNLKEQGWIYFEIHESMGNPIKQLFLDFGFDQVEIIEDFYGKIRMAKARK